MPELICAATDPRWRAIANKRGQLCGHVILKPVGWVSDCDAPALFARITESGDNEYACGEHVKEMPCPS